ncbi:MAG: lysophospholipid acyltransferase family protein [Candidatus Margulisiibacteriota bacterium]
MFILRSLFVYLTAIIGYLFASVLIRCARVFVKDKTRPFLVATLHWAKAVLSSAGVSIKVKNKDNLKDLPKSVVFIANHASYLDIPILAVSLPFGVRFIARENLFRAPFLGWIMRNSSHIPIERKGTKKTLKTMLETAQKVKNGLQVIIFPEGTRSPDGKVRHFKKGSLLIASRAKAAIVPIAISGSHNIMPRHSFFLRPTKVTVTIGNPVEYFSGEKKQDQDEDLILENLRKDIVRMLKEE